MKPLIAILGILFVLMITVLLLLDNRYISSKKVTVQNPYGYHEALPIQLTYTKETFKFTNQNVTKLLMDMKELLDPYISDIKKAAYELKSKNSGWTYHDQMKYVLEANKDGYFREVSTLPSVKTIFAKVDFKDFLKAADSSNYRYGSSDCRKLEAKGKYGKGWAKQAFNDTCLSDFQNTKNTPFSIQIS